MSFGAPWNLLWGLPALGGIVALYLLRRPRRNVAVPSTLLWRSVPQKSLQASRWQRFTPQWLLALQLLAALAAVLAAAAPQWHRSAATGEPLAVVIDDGASMQATDVPGGRFAAAVARAREIVAEDAAAGAPVTLVAAAPPRLLAAPDAGRAALLAALDRLAPSDAAPDIAASVRVAAAALSGAPRAAARPSAAAPAGRIVVVSDGAFDAGSDADIRAAAGRDALAWSPVTPAADARNAGVTRLSIEPDPAAPGRRLQALVRVEEFGGAPRVGGVTLSEGGKIVGRTAAGPPGAAVIGIAAPARPAVLTATLAASGRDDLAADDTAYAVLPAAGVTRVLLVTAGDAPLERALALLPGAQVDVVAPDAYRRSGAPAGYDCYVLDDVAPRGAALPGDTLIWGGGDPRFTPAPAPPPGPQPVVDWERSAPALRFADLADLRVAGPAWQSVGDWEPLIETSAGIVAAQREDGPRRALWLSLLPQASGLAEQPAFPILVSNAVGWLAAGGAHATGTCGDPIALAPVPGGWSVAGPDGRALASPLCDGTPGSPCEFAATSRAGVYTARPVRSGGAAQAAVLFARDIAASSSDITPKPHDLPRYAAAGAAAGGASRRRTLPVSILVWVAAACLLLLAAEWLAYHRPGGKPKLKAKPRPRAAPPPGSRPTTAPRPTSARF